MSQLAEQISKSIGLLSAVEAVTNRRAFITLFSTFTAAALLFALFTAVAMGFLSNGHYDLSKITGGIGFLVVLLVAMTGISATGFLLNDSIRGREQRTISSSLILALATLPRVLGVMLMLFAIGLLLLLSVALVLAICKIPGIGPLLYAIAFPVCAVVLGASFYAMLFVVSLHGPAIWEGNAIMRTVAVLGAIARQRLLSVIIQSILLGMLVGLVTSIIFGALLAGVSSTSLLSLPILGQGSGVEMLMGLASHFMGMGGGNGAGYATAATFGMILLLGCAIVAPALVALSGSCIIFANVTENLSAAVMEKKLQGAIDAVRQKAEEAKRHLEESRNQLAVANTAVTAPAAPSSTYLCPKCNTPFSAGDVFCGNCGNRLG